MYDGAHMYIHAGVFIKHIKRTPKAPKMWYWRRDIERMGLNEREKNEFHLKHWTYLNIYLSFFVVCSNVCNDVLFYLGLTAYKCLIVQFNLVTARVSRDDVEMTISHPATITSHSYQHIRIHIKIKRQKALCSNRKDLCIKRCWAYAKPYFGINWKM